MAFSRTLAPTQTPQADLLTSCMAGIGMNFTAAPSAEPNIEDTILFASIEGVEHYDLRALAVLVTWFGIHAPWVNADRLTKVVETQSSPRLRAFWSALASWYRKDRRFARLARLYVGQRQDLIETGTDFQVRRRGEDPRFRGSAIRVAANVLRDQTSPWISTDRNTTTSGRSHPYQGHRGWIRDIRRIRCALPLSMPATKPIRSITLPESRSPRQAKNVPNNAGL